MRKIANTKDLSKGEWLKIRKESIGGSEAGAICGLNPWKSAISVYFEKTGEIDLPNVDNERMRIGRDLEDYVANRFSESTGKKIRRNNFMMAHDDYPFMTANIDREVVGENAILECKTTNSFSKSDWKDGKIPPHYEIQCHHYMAVTGAERAYIAVLIGNEAFQYQVIERDEEIIDMLIDLESKFWNEYVLKGEAPPPDGSDDYDRILNEKYKDSVEETILLDDGYSTTLERLDEIKELTKKLNQEEKQLQQMLKSAMGENEIAFLADRKITWKSQVRTSLDTKRIKRECPGFYDEFGKTSTIRVFRVS